MTLHGSSLPIQEHPECRHTQEFLRSPTRPERRENAKSQTEAHTRYLVARLRFPGGNTEEFSSAEISCRVLAACGLSGLCLQTLLHSPAAWHPNMRPHRLMVRGNGSEPECSGPTQ